MVLDRVPGDANLYIGGLFTLKRKEALKIANITHVLSVLTLPLDDALFNGYKHLPIDIDDDEDADLIQHFPASNAFIQEGLEGGGGVLVHCAMGKSRSATLVIAYLLSASIAEAPTAALTLLRQCRPVAEPNTGFWSQLELYHRMHCPHDVVGNPQYQRWCWEMEKKRTLWAGLVPGSEHIVFEDEIKDDAPGSSPNSVPDWEREEKKGEAKGNVWYLRRVAEASAKPCDICYKPTTSVLITPDQKDHFYVCPGHLKDRGFCTPIIDEAEAAAKKKKEDLDREIELIKKEYEEKLKKRKKSKESKKPEKDSEKSKGNDTESSKKDETDDDKKAEKEKDDKNLLSEKA
ncbi:MAG: hypothetical protein Q9218_004599 [Villophora microphyllina]